MIKNLIFDFDGVIVDTELLAAKSFSIVLKNMDIIYSAEDIAEKFSGHKMIQVTEDLSKIYKIGDKKIFLAKVMKIMNNYYKNDLTYVEKINHFLNSIKCNFFICSNSGSQRIIKGLEKVKLDHFFDKSKIYTFEHVLRPKPYPDVYLKVINDNNLKKEETLVLEDSIAGVKAAVSANLNVVGITAASHWNNRSPQSLLDAGAFKIVNSYVNFENFLKKV